MPSSEDRRHSRRPRGVVPYKPALLELIQGKNQWQTDPRDAQPNDGRRGWHQRGYLPHRDQPALTQFVTFRLADSFPAELRSEWEALLATGQERDRQQLRKLEEYLDLGRGQCWLRRPALAELVDTALRFFHGSRYELHAWVVMPNHVHVLFTQRDLSVGAVVRSWKAYTARKANRLLGRTGAFWGEDYWDTYMRDHEHELRTRHYIESNPVKARLVEEAGQWPWSSARFRDPVGRLCLPR